MSFIPTIAPRQPSQQGSLIDDPSLEVCTWKIGKNPYPNLVSNRNVPLSENFNALELDLQPEHIVCGDEHAMFVVDGKLYAMGENSDGRLGISKRNVRACHSPMLVRALSNFRVLKVSCGSRHTAALIDTGEVFTWGFGGDGQLGLRNDLTQYSPQYVYLQRNEFYSRNEEPELAIDVSCGSNHTGIISRSGDIYMFGNGESGQLGNGKLQNEHLPFKIRLQSEKAEKIACGKSHTLVLTAKGSLYAFGCNTQGQLGTGGRKSSDTPHKISLFDKVKLVKIQADAHSAGISVTGHLYVWGPCVLGECLTPQRVCKNVENPISDVQISGHFTSLVDFKGKFWVLGAQKRGELGVESLEARTLASQITTLKDKRIRSMSCARDLLIIISEKGKTNNNSPMRAGSVSPSFKDLNASGFRRGLFDTGESAIERKSHQPTQTASPLFNTQSTRQNWRMLEKSFDGEVQERRGTASSRAENLFFRTEDRVEPLLKETVKKSSLIVMTEEIRKDQEMEAMEEDKKVNSVREAESIDFRELKTMKELVDTMNSKEEESKQVKEELMILREPVQEKLKATPQKKERVLMSRGHFSLVDAMNEAESFDMEEPGSFANINGTFFRRGTGEESPVDKKMNDSRVGDMVLDIKVMKVKNSIIESQIEEKAKQLALLESRMDILSHSEVSEEKSQTQSEVVVEELEPIAKSLFTTEVPSKSIQTQDFNMQFDVEPQEDHTASVRKQDESVVLVDSLVKENKSLRGLVNYLLHSKDRKSSEAFESNQSPHNLFQSRDMDAESRSLSPASPNKRKLYARSQTLDMDALPSVESTKAKVLNRSIDIEVFPKIKPIQKKFLNKSLTSSNIDEILLNDHHTDPVLPSRNTPTVWELGVPVQSVQTTFPAKDMGSSLIEDLSPIHPLQSKIHMRQAEAGTEPLLTIQPIQTRFHNRSQNSSQIEELFPNQPYQPSSNRDKSNPAYEDFSPIQPVNTSLKGRYEKNDYEPFTPATALGDTALKTPDSYISPYELQIANIGTPELGSGVGGSVEEDGSVSSAGGLDNSLNLKSFKTSFSSMQNKNWNAEESNKNSSKDKNSKRTSVVDAFVIAPPPGYKTKSGSKSPSRSPTDAKIPSFEATKEDPRLLRLRKVARSTSMSFGSESETVKVPKPSKIIRTSSLRTEGDVSSPIGHTSMTQSPGDQSKMSARGRRSTSEADSPVARNTVSLAKSPKSGKKVKKTKKKTNHSEVSISVVKTTNQSMTESTPVKKPRSPSKALKVEKSSAKVNRSVVMLKPTAPKEEKRMSRTGQKNMLVTFTANLKEKTPEKTAAKSIKKKKMAAGSRVSVTEADNTTTSKFLQSPSFISSATKSPEHSQILAKSDTLPALPGKFGKILNESDKGGKGHSQAKSISIIREPTLSNHVSKFEEEKDSTLFDIIDNSFSKQQHTTSFMEKPLSNSVIVSPTPERRQVSYSQAEALARLLGPSKAKKVTKNKMMKAASKSGIKRTNTTEFYDQLSEVIKVNTTMK